MVLFQTKINQDNNFLYLLENTTVIDVQYLFIFIFLVHFSL